MTHTIGAATVAILGASRTAYAGTQHIRDAIYYFHAQQAERQAKLASRQERLESDPELQTARDQAGLLDQYREEQVAAAREAERQERDLGRRKIGIPPFLKDPRGKYPFRPKYPTRGELPGFLELRDLKENQPKSK